MAFNFTNVTKRLSTWCSGIAAAATAASLAYSQLPTVVQALVPQNVTSIIALASAIFVPLATSFKQASLAE